MYAGPYFHLIRGPASRCSTYSHTATSGLVAARRGQDTDLSLTRVTALLLGPQYAVTSTSSWLQAAVQAAVSQVTRMTRSGAAAAPGGPGGP